jgi:hypothetical protein
MTDVRLQRIVSMVVHQRETILRFWPANLPYLTCSNLAIVENPRLVLLHVMNLQY